MGNLACLSTLPRLHLTAMVTDALLIIAKRSAGGLSVADLTHCTRGYVVSKQQSQCTLPTAAHCCPLLPNHVDVSSWPCASDKPHTRDQLLSENRKLLPTVFSEGQMLSGRTFPSVVASSVSADDVPSTAYCRATDSFMFNLHTGPICTNPPRMQSTAFLHGLHYRSAASQVMVANQIHIHTS